MTLHTYEVTLNVQRLETVQIVIDDADPIWCETPDEDTLLREAKDKAYARCNRSCYVVDAVKLSP